MDHIGKQKNLPHPRRKANIVSVLCFFYTLKLFRKGTKRPLEEEDLYDVLPNYKSEKLGDKFEQEWEKQKKSKGKNSIIRLIISVFGLEVILLGVTQLISKVFQIVFQPLALSKIISYFNTNQTEMTKNDLYLWAGLLIGVNLLDTVYAHNYHMAMGALGIRIRTAFCSFIYRKALKLSPSRLGDISVGKIVTLITKDVEVLQHFSYLLNDIWIAGIKAAVAGYIIYRKIQMAAVAGVGFFVIVLPLQFYIGTWAAKLRLKMCKRVDERLQNTQETLSAIKIIKMYTWEKFFNEKVINSREKEIKSMQLIFYLKFVILQIGVINGKIAFYLLIMAHKWFGNHITAELMYYVDHTFHILTHTLGVRFPSAISQVAEVTASVKRLGNVLKALELEQEETISDLVIKPKIILKDVDVTFKEKQILHKINLNIDMGVTLITGPVGSGKSFLLKTILKEFLPSTGNVETEGRISYASQEPWLFPSSIKQNILFGNAYDEARYQEVLKVCALLYDFELLADGDRTIVEDRGNNLSKGQQARVSLARAVYKESEIYLLDDCLSALDSQVSAFIFKECIIKYLRNKLVIFVSHNVSHVKEVDNVVVMRHGAVTSYGKSTEISENEILEEVNEDVKAKDELDVEDETNEETKLITETTTERKVYQETRQKGKVQMNVYMKYLQFGGGIFAFLLILIMYGAYQFVVSYSDTLLSQWVIIEQKLANLSLAPSNNTRFNITLQEQKIEHKLDWTIKLYSIMISLLAIFGFAKSFAYYSVMRRASINLHKYMITHIVNATMHFFDSNFIGNILNRFSKDLTIVDEYLPFIYHQVIRTAFSVIGVMTVIATVNFYFLIPTVLFFGLLVIIRAYYLRTARSLKRLDATTRSPVVGHLNATLEGLTTIRAFKAENILREEYDRHQDVYTSASYIFMNSMRAFAFILDTLCVFFIAIIIARFAFSNDAFLAGSVGLAISQALRMTGTLQWGVRIWAEMESCMTSVERVLEYTQVKQESKQGQTLKDWPQKGEVKYKNVSLCYKEDSSDYVLKNINFTVHPKEKIGIVGRTGAGKSSIISTLFRLYEVKGKITIDGIDIKSLTLACLRKHVSIIPQDPVLFTGTIRDNIDPEGIYTDEVIWKAIDTAYLTKLTPSLNYEITEGGSSFSVGQRQLICVARAIVRNNKIIVMDEATANMDPETDTLIHETIAKCFQDCTVFTIAHKLHSIINCDKIIVMDKGEIVEFDDPNSLLQNKEGHFYTMVKKSGMLPEKISS